MYTARRAAVAVGARFVVLDPLRLAVEMLVAAQNLYPAFQRRYDSHAPRGPTCPTSAPGPDSARRGEDDEAVICVPPPSGLEPPTPTGSGFSPEDTMLRDAAPADLGLDPAPIAEAVALIRSHEEAPDGRAFYAGAVGVMGHDGRVILRHASGWALRHADASTEMSRDEWAPMRHDTVVDLASISKLFTAITVVQLVQEGHVDLGSPVAAYLPAFAAHGKESVTVRQLLAHTSGFAPWMPLWSDWPDRDARIAAVLDEPLVSPPGAAYRYSDLNLITVGVLVERLRGAPLDVVVRDRVTGPLGMERTGYTPTDPLTCAATEFQISPPRGMVRGEVHDENAWSLGGVAGHAGVFSTADDLAVLAQTLLNGGAYGGRRILAPESVTALVADVNAAFPGHAHGLGFELDQRWYMDDLTGPHTVGHTGFTGTSIVIDFSSHSFAILLTNRVHPSRAWGSATLARQEWAHGLAAALGRTGPMTTRVPPGRTP